MKILHVITCIADSGGAEKLMEDLLPGLKQKGCDVSCLVFNGFDSNNRRTLEKSGIQVFELSHNTHYYSPIKLLKLIIYVRKYDIVHAHNTPAVVFTALASFLCRTKLVMTVHNTEGKLRHIWGLSSFDKFIHRRYDYVICCSKMAEACLKEYLPDLPNVITINNGISLNKFLQAVPIVEMGCPGIKNIVMVAWFRKQKHHSTVIDTLLYLPNEFHVFFVGEGETKNECMGHAEKLGLSERVHFLGLRADVPSILKAADYIVLSSYYEGLSLSSIEGMAVGKPFIASDVKGLREIVDGAGVLFPEGDATELASSILKLDSDRELYEKVAQRCKERALAYDVSSMIDGYKEVYDSLDNAQAPH